MSTPWFTWRSACCTLPHSAATFTPCSCARSTTSLGGELSGAGVLLRHHDVDAVRLAVDVLVDPVELDLELVVRERQRAEHAETARLADGGHDVAAVAEREDRQVDAEHLARAGLHACTSAIVATFWAHG